MALSVLIQTVTQLGLLAVLGRFFSPDEFGVISKLLIVLNIVVIFAEMQLSAAIIQRPNPTREELSSLYWFNVLVGVGMYLLLFFLAGPLAAGFDEPLLVPLVRLVAIRFLVSPFGAQFLPLLRKKFDFRSVALIMTSGKVVEHGATVIFVLAGSGLYAVPYGQIVGGVVLTGLLVAAAVRESWLPGLRLRAGDLRGYLSFGLHQVGARVVDELNGYTDQIVIGSLMSSAGLGLYNMAYLIASQPFRRVMPVFTMVMFPVLAKLQAEQERLKNAFVRYVEAVTTLAAPLLLGLAAVAPTAIPVLVGEQWRACVPLVQILCVMTLTRCVSQAGLGLVLAKGKANWNFYFNVLYLAILTAGIFLAVALRKSLLAIALAGTLASILLAVGFYFVCLRRLLGPFAREYTAALLRPLLIAAAMALVTWIISFLPASVPAALSLTLQVLGGGAFYVFAVRAWNRPIYELVLEEYLGPVLEKFRGQASPPKDENI